MLNLRGHLQERVPLSSRVTLGSRVSLFLCITQFAFHAREGALGVGSPYLEDRKKSTQGRDKFCLYKPK